MKIAIIGAGGLRTPLILGAIEKRAAALGITETTLMDTDTAALDRMVRLTALLATGSRSGSWPGQAGRAGGTCGSASGGRSGNGGGDDGTVSGAGNRGHGPGGSPPPALRSTTSLQEALAQADFVITTFRAGGMEGRIRDERIARAHGVLGQETTGFGGFAMALRSLPVLEGVIEEMRRSCPRAWLVNFANPSGLLTEAAFNRFGWERTVGICDAPSQIHAIVAAVLGIEKSRLAATYFGLNHLGWFSSFAERTGTGGIGTGESGVGENLMPGILRLLESAGSLPGFPFPGRFLSNLGLIPNEYLAYYYFREASMARQRERTGSRGETIQELNRRFLADLDPILARGDGAGAAARYFSYITARQESSVAQNTPGGESALKTGPEAAGAGAGASTTKAGTGGARTEKRGSAEETEFTKRFVKAITAAMSDHEGYPGVALDVIGGLCGLSGGEAIVNVRNDGAISGMDRDDVVEIPVRTGLSADAAGQTDAAGRAGRADQAGPAGQPAPISPIPIGTIPRHCLGLMLQVKEFEKRTIAASAEKSRSGAVTALALHPLIGDIGTAEKLITALEKEEGSLFSSSARISGRTEQR